MLTSIVYGIITKLRCKYLTATYGNKQRQYWKQHQTWVNLVAANIRNFKIFLEVEHRTTHSNRIIAHERGYQNSSLIVESLVQQWKTLMRECGNSAQFTRKQIDEIVTTLKTLTDFAYVQSSLALEEIDQVSGCEGPLIWWGNEYSWDFGDFKGFQGIASRRRLQQRAHIALKSTYEATNATLLIEHDEWFANGTLRMQLTTNISSPTNTNISQWRKQWLKPHRNLHSLVVFIQPCRLHFRQVAVST